MQRMLAQVLYHNKIITPDETAYKRVGRSKEWNNEKEKCEFFFFWNLINLLIKGHIYKNNTDWIYTENRF